MKKQSIIYTLALLLLVGTSNATEYDVILTSQSDLNITESTSTSGIVAGTYTNKSVLIQDAQYKNISVTLDREDNTSTQRIYGGITSITGTLTVQKSTFENLDMNGQYQVQGGAIYITGAGSKASISGSTFNEITSTVGDYSGSLNYASEAMGSAIIAYRADLDVSNTTFSNNTVQASTSSRWVEAGAVYLMMTGKPDSSHTAGEKVSFTNVTFSNNKAVNTVDASYSQGGAIEVQGRYDGVYDDTRSLTFTDTIFNNNSAAKGGAIHSNAQSMTFKVTSGKNLSYTGNKSTSGVENGGFLLIDASNTSKNVSATFDIDSNATLSIGEKNGDVNADSISSVKQGSVTIVKTGAGDLIVNGSMEYYSGVLEVQQGNMVVNSTLGASDIIIASNAKLTLGADTNIILYGCSITVENGGTLELGSNTHITVNLEEDFTGTASLFNIAEDASLSQDGETITLAGLEENITVTYNGQTLDKSEWSFDAETGTITSSVVPEPAEWATIFSVIILGFVIYRRRK